jgi:hypothetical protein
VFYPGTDLLEPQNHRNGFGQIKNGKEVAMQVSSHPKFTESRQERKK